MYFICGIDKVAMCSNTSTIASLPKQIDRAYSFISKKRASPFKSRAQSENK